MRLILREFFDSELLKVVLLCVASNIWMFFDGWFKSDEYIMNFSFSGPNKGSFLPFIPKFFALVFGYYIAAAGLGGDMHDTRYIPLLICLVIYLFITFGYFHTYKNKRWLYLVFFSAAFLLSTVPHYLIILVSGMMDGSRTSRSTGANSNSNSYNKSSDDFDASIIQQGQNYHNNLAAEQERQSEIKAGAMGFHSADEAKQSGFDV